mgnify:CR=1 FL=1
MREALGARGGRFGEHMAVTCEEIISIFDELIPYQYSQQDRRARVQPDEVLLVADGALGQEAGCLAVAVPGHRRQVGAVAAGRRLYAALHVLSVAGTTPSLTARVESSADDTFAIDFYSSPACDASGSGEGCGFMSPCVPCPQASNGVGASPWAFNHRAIRARSRSGSRVP